MSDRTHEVLLDALYTEVKEGCDREAVQIVIATADDWMYAERWDIGDALLATADIEQLEVTVAIGVLAALYPVRAHTPAREGFIKRLETYLFKSEPQHVAQELLRGLR